MIVVEGRLAKMKKEAKLTKEKRGNVVICPNCGAEVEAGSFRCKECGYVFTNVKAVQSVKDFFNEIKSAMAEGMPDESISEMIRNFPVPTAKEDILESCTWDFQIARSRAISLHYIRLQLGTLHILWP